MDSIIQNKAKLATKLDKLIVDTRKNVLNHYLLQKLMNISGRLKNSTITKKDICFLNKMGIDTKIYLN
jgi:hypothetical protein